MKKFAHEHLVVVAASALWLFGMVSIASASEAAGSEGVQAGTTTAAPATEATDSGDRIICRREAVLGSNIKKRVCHTAAQEAEIRQASQQTMQELLQRDNGEARGAGP